jgi:hypothetical protein
MNSIDYAIIEFGRQVLHLLPYADLTIEGFAIGEWAWVIAIIAILGEVYLLISKKKVSR